MTSLPENPQSPRPPVAFIVGATASGKTAAAIALAAQRRIEVINADSRQVYRGMSIGTAKPTQEQRAACAHHLIDVADPDEPFNLARFLELARAAIDDALARGALPVVVGGSGQYVWALAEGWEAPRVAPQPALRTRLEALAAERGPEALHERLAALDPDAASFVDPRNTRRLVRALEVVTATGRPLSAQRRKLPPPFEVHLVGLWVARAELHRRIDARIEEMLSAGWLNEVRALLAAGYTPELPSFSSAGYRQLAAHIAGDLTLEQAIEQAHVAHRTLVRRQATWFRAADKRILWYEDAAELVEGLPQP